MPRGPFFVSARLRPMSSPDPTENSPPPESRRLTISRVRPPGSDSVPAAPSSRADRGRTTALAALGGFVVLGLILIAKSPDRPAPAITTTTESAPVVITSAAADASAPAEKAASADAGARPPPVWRVGSQEEPGTEILRGTLGKHTLAGALSQAGISRNEIRRVTHAIDGMHRLEKASGKDAFVVGRDRSSGAITAFEVIASPSEVWQSRAAAGEELTVKKLDLFVERKRSQSAVAITADLKQAITAAGLREEAIDEIDDALEGHADTAVIKPGVRLRVIGSEEWVEGAFTGYRVDAVEYTPPKLADGQPLRLYYFEHEGRHHAAGYYDTKGQQPYRGTFRSPVPLARITSRFNPKRMHPVLHTIMPHNGIDFGASTGTPVFAASAGTIQSAGDSGPCGNMVQIDHTGGLTTAYCHLSRFAAGIHPGVHVEARQLVGYVGATGRVTGPHLHFAVKRSGNFIDPLALKIDGVRTLPSADREAFAKKKQELDAALDGVTLPAADPNAAATPDDENKDEPGGEE